MIIGGKGSGKTSLGRSVLLQLLREHTDRFGLVVDTLDHPSYRDIVQITPDMISRARRGVYRVFGSDTGVIMSEIQQGAYNCVAMFEDAAKYFDGKLTTAQEKFVLDSKQMNLDLIFMFHGYSFVPPKLYRLVDSVWILKTMDSPAASRGKVTCLEQLNAAYEKVSALADYHTKGKEQALLTGSAPNYPGWEKPEYEFPRESLLLN